MSVAGFAGDDDLSHMSERRFNEAEVAEIFERAAESQQTTQHQLPSREGMLRRRQMEDIATRTAVIASPPISGPSGDEP